MLTYLIIFILLVSTILCFSLLIRCMREKHNNNYENIVTLSERICELESKLDKINKKISILNKK